MAVLTLLSSIRCRRNTRYVTLKILGARDSRYEHDLDFYRKLEILQAEDGEHAGQEHFVKLFDTFVIQGPNGAHRCLVLELMGPNLIDMLDENEKYLIKVRKGSVLLEGWQKYVFPHAVVKGIARQVLSGIAYLHSRGITLGGESYYHQRDSLTRSMWPRSVNCCRCQMQGQGFHMDNSCRTALLKFDCRIAHD